MSTKAEGNALSEREEQVLVYATQGLTDKEIARKLGISTATVLTYWMRIRQKLGGSNRAELVAAAVRRDAESVLGIKETENHQLLSEILRRMQAEQALREAHQRLNFHFDNTPISVIEWDSDFRVSRWSVGAENTFGWSGDEVEGKKPAEWKFFYEEDAGRVTMLSQDLVAGRASHGFIACRNYRKDGTVLDCEWYHSALVDDDGKFVSVLSVVLDLTERNRYQRELQDSQARLQAIIDASPSITVIKDPEGRYLLVNRECERVTGLKREDILGKTDQDIFPSQTADRIQAHDREALESNKPTTQTLEIETGSGVKRVSMTKFSVIGQSGMANAVCGVGSELRNIGDEAVFEAAFSALPSAALILDDEGRCLFANAAAAQVLGQAVGDLAGVRFQDLLPTAFAKEAKDHVGRLSTGTGFEALYAVSRPDEELAYVQWKAVPNIMPGKHLCLGEPIDRNTAQASAEPVAAVR
ncbi:MAG TPA: PAS domain-containing protein [Fimbriimonadaceae bacterium]|nr:PAS domain-containing protein [Fimbriimonadaceae bacterium]